MNKTLEEQAWLLYCEDTAGGMDVKDHWDELPYDVQELYLSRVQTTQDVKLVSLINTSSEVSDTIERAKVVELLESMKSGWFGERDTLEEASEYAVSLLKASSKDEREFSTHIAIGVYHNTVANVLIKALEVI